MRIRTYGVVRGVMLKHPPTRFAGTVKSWAPHRQEMPFSAGGIVFRLISLIFTLRPATIFRFQLLNLDFK